MEVGRRISRPPDERQSKHDRGSFTGSTPTYLSQISPRRRDLVDRLAARMLSTARRGHPALQNGNGGRRGGGVREEEPEPEEE